MLSNKFALLLDKPVIAQLVEHLTVDLCRYQMVPGSIPGDRISRDMNIGFSVVYFGGGCSTSSRDSSVGRASD